MSTADLLLHPVRLRIIQALAGRPMTPLQLRDVLGDVPQATMYRQLNRLHDGGLVAVTDERPVRGGVERTYTVVEDEVQLTAEQLGDAGPEDHLGYFTTFLGTLLTGFARYVERDEIDLTADGVGYHQTPLWLSDEEFAEMNEQLAALIRSGYGNQPAPGRKRRLLATIVYPDAVEHE